MQFLKDKVTFVVFFLVFGFFVIFWSDLIYPIFSNRGTIGNGILVVLLSLLWGWCASYSVSIFIKLKKYLKIGLIALSPAWLMISIYINSEAYYRNLGNWLINLTDWQINIYFFDWGGYLIFSSLGIFCMIVALNSFIFKKYSTLLAKS